jgi:hypothetical protein
MKLALIATTLSLLVGTSAVAQTTAQSSDPETLTTGGSATGMKLTGWFLAPTVGTTTFTDGVRYLPGLRAGLYLNEKFAVGIAAHALVGSDTKLEGDDLRNLGTYGGLLLQYVWRSDQLIHGTLESTIGDGRWCTAGTDGACSQFMVLEPAANVEINVAKHVRLATGVGYRLAVTGDGDGPSTRDVSGLVIRSSLIFGSF